MLVPQFTIASFDDAEKLLLTPGNGFTDIVSIGEPNSKRPQGYALAEARKLRLEFDDVSHDNARLAGYLPPSEEDVRTLITFIARSRKRMPQPRKWLFHCAAGISRSAASATVLMVMFTPPGQEHTAVKMMKLMKPDIDPNRKIIGYADKILERGGRLIRAVEAVFPRKIVVA